MEKNERLDLICFAFGQEWEFAKLIDDFRIRQMVKNFDKQEEQLRELRIAEFSINSDDKEEFLQWLANRALCKDNPNFSGIKNKVIEMATDFKIIPMPENTLNKRGAVDIYLIAERKRDKSVP